MIPRVIKAEYEKNYIIHVWFADGTKGNVDLGQELHGEVFEPLKNKDTFKQFRVHPEFHTICWPNGADIAPEFLYENVRG
ncbi:MAG: Protein of unknown function (DUF2442) [Candidatus Kentron sp. G]|nr:MAG: Protein of unknown function (DUF2442) [Candidatus Kentron sp. G]VFM96647.1 MAG: Protein of unknown function (DUF2442) [Candidatus Kentron sp. G]VFN03059.1 MAG: Protein of unknown function (DUF2442) [Candidatus Kentron sp. G]